MQGNDTLWTLTVGNILFLETDKGLGPCMVTYDQNVTDALAHLQDPNVYHCLAPWRPPWLLTQTAHATTMQTLTQAPMTSLNALHPMTTLLIFSYSSLKQFSSLRWYTNEPLSSIEPTTQAWSSSWVLVTKSRTSKSVKIQLTLPSYHCRLNHKHVTPVSLSRAETVQHSLRWLEDSTWHL